MLANPQTAEPMISALHHNVQRLCRNLNIPQSPSPIVPILLGSEDLAMQTSARLRDAGFLVPAIRFPTVARGQARLRVALSAAHTEAAIDDLSAALQSAD
jgi:7-keto-8-aminopelargonate synthetase-like enzyme